MIKFCYWFFLPSLMLAKLCGVEGVLPWPLLLWPYLMPLLIPVCVWLVAASIMIFGILNGKYELR